jgi:hypothetical protein
VLFHKFPEESIQAKIIAPVVPSIILPQGNISFLDQFCLSDGASGNYPLRAPKKRRSTPNCPEVRFWGVTHRHVSSSPRLSFTASLSFCLQPR